jgi:SAM-dependent methyltransferase
MFGMYRLKKVMRKMTQLMDGRVTNPPHDFGIFRRISPISREFGVDRGQAVDRRYIEAFLEANRSRIRGRVLEIGDDRYTRMFGGAQVVQSDVLNPMEGFPDTTIQGDLQSCEGVIACDSFDCVILSQVLQFIYDVKAALASVHRILKPGGCALATFAGISQVSRWDQNLWGDYWRFTEASASRLFAEAFPGGRVEVKTHGNVLTSICFLHGLAAHELEPEDFEPVDPDYPMLITVLAQKA